MKIALAIFLIFTSLCSFGAERKLITLLTSVTHKKIDIEHKLERIFRNKFKNYPFDLRVVHKADQEILSRELSNSSNDAVFWVSHGAFISPKNLNQSAGVAPVSMILDYNRDNVAPVFQKLHPNLEFLGIIGCNSKQILETYKEDNVWQSSEDTPPVEYISKTKSIAQYALKKAIRKFKKAYKYRNLPKDNVKASYIGYPITITRTLPPDIDSSEIRSLRVMNNGKFLGIMEKIEPGQTMSKTFYIPIIDKYSQGSFKIEVNTGESVYKEKEKIHFGDLIVENGSSVWTLFAKPTGEAFGINKRMFLYRGNHSIMDSTLNYSF